MIASATVLLLILLPILLSLIISLPSVQNRLVQRITSYVTEYLGTEVSIGNIDVTMRGALDIRDFLVRDLQGDVLLTVDRLQSQFVGYLPITQNLRLGHSSVEGGALYLRGRMGDDGVADMNLRQLIRLFSKRNEESKFSLSISTILIDGFDLTIDQLTHKNPEYGVDLRDLEMRSLSGSALEFSISGPTLHTFVERLSGVEKSGFEVSNVAGELYLTDGAMSIVNMSLESEWSNLDINHLMLASGSWAGYRDFDSDVTINLDVRGGSLSSDDVAYFAPAMRDWGVNIYDVEFLATGSVDDLLLNIKNISYGNETTLSSEVSLLSLNRADSLSYEVSLRGLRSSALDIDQLSWAIMGDGLSQRSYSIVDALGEFTLRGSIEGDMEGLDVNVNLESESGGAVSEMSIGLGDALSLEGGVSVSQLALGRLLGRDDLGLLTMGVDVKGTIEERDVKGWVSVDVSSVGWNNYLFEGLRGSSFVSDGGATNIVVESSDPKVDFSLSGDVEGVMFGGVPRYDLRMNMRELDLCSLGINRRDSISKLAGRLTMRGEGRSIEDCWGDVDVKRGEYIVNVDTLRTDAAALTFKSEEGSRRMILESEFIDLDFSSRSKMRHILEYAKGSMSNYLPSVYTHPERVMAQMKSLREEQSPEQCDSLASDYSRLRVVAKDISPLVGALVRGVTIGEGSSVELDFSPECEVFDLKVSSPYFERGTTLAVGLDVDARSSGDSLILEGGIRELLWGTSFIEGAHISASARDDRVNFEGNFSNPTDSASVAVGATIVVRNEGGRGREVDLNLHPSTLNRRQEEWTLSARSIMMSREGVDIDNFRVESRDQLMTLNGLASTSTVDTVRMRLKNFDLSIFSTLIEQLGYRIDGRTNGEMMISSALEAARFEAEVELDSVSVNTLAAPPMLMRAQWDSKLNQARLSLENRDTRDTLIRGYYVPTEVRYYATLKVDSLKMAMLDPPLGGVIEDTEGTADLDLVLRGNRRNAHLNGTITANNVATTVAYTKVRYNIKRSVIDVEDNMLIARNAQIRDEKGGRGAMSLDVDLQHLSNIGYKLSVSPRKMLVLNTEERDNDTFYGQLFATGVVDIEGDKSGVHMNIVARSESDSHFFMPLTSKSNISTADFITFVQPQRADTTELQMRRRMMLERGRRAKGSGSMSINMALDVQPNTELQLVIDPTVGDIIKAKGEGRLNINIEPKSNIFDIYGDYTISEGNYLFTLRNIVNKRFVIDPGSSIQWSGAPADPLLDINAIYKLKASLQPLFADESSRAIPVDCIINLSDHLTQPEVSFAIDLPSADPEQQSALANLLNDQETISRQFFYLMLANSFIPETSTGGTSDLGVSTTAATGFELLTNQLSNWLSSSNYNVVIRYRPESDLAGDEVDFGFSKGLINNRLLVELEGNYIIDNKQAISEDASNFMGEAYITWLIDRAGALRLRGFTQTIDRYDENQGLQETGIGVYYRENFENFKDLRERVRARFKASPERQERREERRAEGREERQDEANSDNLESDIIESENN